jgi:hypothetical protein
VVASVYPSVMMLLQDRSTPVAYESQSVYHVVPLHSLEQVGTYLLQEHGHNDPRHATISGDYEAWEKVGIFGPEGV